MDKSTWIKIIIVSLFIGFFSPALAFAAAMIALLFSIVNPKSNTIELFAEKLIIWPYEILEDVFGISIESSAWPIVIMQLFYGVLTFCIAYIYYKREENKKSMNKDFSDN